MSFNAKRKGTRNERRTMWLPLAAEMPGSIVHYPDNVNCPGTEELVHREPEVSDIP